MLFTATFCPRLAKLGVTALNSPPNTRMTTTVTRIETDPDTRHHRWQPLAQIKTAIPEDYRHWVVRPGSLTRALKERSDRFHVKVLDQSHLYIALPIDGFDNHSGPCGYFSRKVLLMHGDTPWVAAHTLVPETSLRHGLRQLTKLEEKPLGELLFSSPGVVKDHQQACQTENGWGRRARYLLKQQPLLVSEFFLPALVEYEHNRSLSLY